MNGIVSRLPRALLLLAIAIVAGSLYLGAAHPAVAQDNPDCEDPDTVACLPTTPPPTTDGSQSGTAAAGSGAAPAAAAPAIPGTPPGAPLYCPPPPPYPVPPRPVPPVAEPAEPIPPTAAAPAPVAAPAPPYPCVFDIYGAINRANLAYARAMRNLDTSQLYLYWGGRALQDLLGQVNDLWYSGTYRILRLRSIQVVDQSFGPGGARVHTRERWTTETWTFDGYQWDSGDAWYDNYYTLTWAGGRWLITTDVVY